MREIKWSSRVEFERKYTKCLRIYYHKTFTNFFELKAFASNLTLISLVRILEIEVLIFVYWWWILLVSTFYRTTIKLTLSIIVIRSLRRKMWTQTCGGWRCFWSKKAMKARLFFSLEKDKMKKMKWWKIIRSGKSENRLFSLRIFIEIFGIWSDHFPIWIL